MILKTIRTGKWKEKEKTNLFEKTYKLDITKAKHASTQTNQDNIYIKMSPVRLTIVIMITRTITISKCI